MLYVEGSLKEVDQVKMKRYHEGNGWTGFLCVIIMLSLFVIVLMVHP